LLKSQQTLPIVFNHFNQAVRWFKKLINQTNQKRFSLNRTRKNSTNQPNQKRLISIEHSLSVTLSLFFLASLLKQLKHANIVTLHDIIHTKDTLMFVFEFVVSFLINHADMKNKYGYYTSFDYLAI